MEVYRKSRAEWCAWLEQRGHKPIHASALWRGLYVERAARWADVERIPERVRSDLEAEHPIPAIPVARTVESVDRLARKDVIAWNDGARIETVVMRYDGRVTACLSTQVGCAMGCVFCASGQMGFGRHLTAGEIVAQVVHANRVLEETRSTAELACPEHRSAHGRHERLRNAVFMGMGEPLHNLDQVLRAFDILTDPSGLAMAARKLTVSTVGVVPGIQRLTQLRHPANLAVSLHAATQEQREALVPAARRWSLDELLAACRHYTEALNRRIFFEWTLIDGDNDSAADAHRVGRLLEGIDSQVNLIPLNPTGGYRGRPSSTARAFQEILAGHGLPSTVRQRRGIEIAAGCGQLATE